MNKPEPDVSHLQPEEPLPSTPGQMIKASRDHYAMTQTDLAERMGKGQNSISEYESDQRLPDTISLADLMVALGWTGETVRQFLLLARKGA